MSEEKFVDELTVEDVSCICPWCHKIIRGLVADPRGEKEQCEHCNKFFMVNMDVNINIEWKNGSAS